MEGGALYGNIARYYDLVYHNKDYEEEAIKIIKLVRKNKKNDGRKLLDIGCGTGGHLVYLNKHFECIGMDIFEKMLDIAREKMANVKLVQGDMTDFDLEDRFDIIITMFGTIGYCKDLEMLERTFVNIHSHLNPGGVFICEPWLDPGSFNEGIPFLHYYDGDGLKIARVTSSLKRDNMSVIHMHYLIGKEGSEVEYHSDVHKMGLFEISDTRKILEQIGFKVKYDEKGIGGHQGIFIALKE
jgi:SAM-dependent methyltransferase